MNKYESNHFIDAIPVSGVGPLFSVSEHFDTLDMDGRPYAKGGIGLGGVNTETGHYCPENLPRLVAKDKHPLTYQALIVMTQATLGVATAAEL